LLGVPKMKIHAKLCIIKKRKGTKTIQYGFVSTGNLNENTARLYGDHCLLTANRNVMADINRIFHYLENWKTCIHHLRNCKTLILCPVSMRRQIIELIDKEIRHAKAGKLAGILLKVNSLSDAELIHKLNEAAVAGVEIKMIVRGIFCMLSDHKKHTQTFSAVSIVDEYLEHARVMIFHNLGKEKIYTSSADWMVRNLDHRVEAAIPVTDPAICQELKEIIHIQLRDNVKARILDNDLANNYVPSAGKKHIRSQIETYHYLYKKNAVNSEVSRH
jgi:polyphosphate kinase